MPAIKSRIENVIEVTFPNGCKLTYLPPPEGMIDWGLTVHDDEGVLLLRLEHRNVTREPQSWLWELCDCLFKAGDMVVESTETQQRSIPLAWGGRLEYEHNPRGGMCGRVAAITVYEPGAGRGDALAIVLVNGYAFGPKQSLDTIETLVERIFDLPDYTWQLEETRIAWAQRDFDRRAALYDDLEDLIDDVSLQAARQEDESTDWELRMKVCDMLRERAARS